MTCFTSFAVTNHSVRKDSSRRSGISADVIFPFYSLLNAATGFATAALCFSRPWRHRNDLLHFFRSDQSFSPQRFDRIRNGRPYGVKTHGYHCDDYCRCSGNNEYQPTDTYPISKIFKPFIHNPPCYGTRN